MKLIQSLKHILFTAEPVSKPVLAMMPMGDISEGQDLTLICTVDRGTPPINFTWYHTDTKGALFSQTGKRTKGSYSINNVEGEHGGGYYCESTNQADEAKQSHTVVIRGGLYSLLTVETMVVRVCSLLSVCLATHLNLRAFS